MRIAVVAAETTRSGGGEAAARREQVASVLGGRGHDVCVFCTRWWEDDSAETEADSVTYRAVAADDVPGRRFAFRLVRHLRRFDPGVIVAANEPLGVLGSAFAATAVGAPLVVDWYDHAPTEAWSGRIEGLIARTPNLVVVPSRLIETGVIEHGRSDRGTAVIPTGVDFEAVRSIEEDPLADIVYSRPLDGNANLESLLLGLAEFREGDWTAAVVGDGPARGQYEAQAADLRIDDRVEFLGEQPRERRIALFKGAHVAVHTALYAPFALDFLRALACGCVGIAEYHAGSSAHELVEHHERGFRTTSEDQLVGAVRDGLELPFQSIDESFEDYDEDAVIERYLDHFRRLMPTPPPP